jgi:hypothetical protein
MRIVLCLSALLVLAGCAADAAEEAETALRVGPFERVEGARHLRAHLSRQGGGYGASVRGSGQPDQPVNVLFYDIDGREGRWLFEDSERAILSERDIGDSARVRMVVYEVAEEDTNGDDRFDHGDARTIAVSDPQGRRLVRLAEGVTQYRETIRLDDDTVLVLFDSAGTVRTIEVGLDDLGVEAEVTLPRPPGAGPSP